MNAKNLSLAAFAAVAMSSLVANAATVSLDYTLPTPSGPMPTAVSTGGYVDQNIAGDITSGGGPVRRSPWSGTLFENDGRYSAALQGSSASYSFAGFQWRLDLMWGTPEATDTIEFLLNNVVQHTVTGASVLTAANPAPDFVNVSIGEFRFDSLQFRSFGGSFEFAELKVTEIPLPATVWTMIAVLCGLGFVALRGKAA